MIRGASPIVGAFLFAGCSLFSSSPAKPTPAELAKLRALAACVESSHCTSRACLEAALLRCSADAIPQGGGGAGGSGGASGAAGAGG